MIKKIGSVCFALVIMCAYLGVFTACAASFNINIVHTSDMSGNIFKNEEKGTIGYGNVLSVKENIGDPIVLDSGNFLADTSQKNTGLNGKIVYAMNKAGYQYAALGANDLKYPKNEIDTILRSADFEIISSNIMVGEELAYKDVVTKMVNGVKVGIFAVTDAEATGDFNVADPEAAAAKAVKQLKSGGSKVIIALVNTKDADFSKKLATQNPDITMIIESGTGNFMPSGVPEGRTLIVNPGSKGNAVGVSAVTINDGQLQSFQTSNYNLSNIKEVYPDTNTLEKEMGNAQNEIDSLNNDIICTLSENLPYDEAEIASKSVPLGNFVADVIKEVTGADMAIIRGSNITGGLSKGVTGKELNSLLFENSDITVKEISGASLFKVMELAVNKIVANGTEVDTATSESKNFLQIAGFTVFYNPEYAPGKRIVKIVTDDGKKIGSFNKTMFKIAGPSEIFTSYSEYLTSAETVEIKENSIQLFRDYMTKNDEITVDTLERVKPTDAKKSYMWIVWSVLGGFAAAIIVAYIIAKIVMVFNDRY